MTKVTKAEAVQRKAESLAFLRKHIKPGDAIYSLIPHVSRSGMSRNVRLFMPHLAEHIETVDLDASVRLSGEMRVYATKSGHPHKPGKIVGAMQAGEVIIVRVPGAGDILSPRADVRIDRVTMVPRIMPITWYVAHATGATPLDRGEWVIGMGGAGYDAGFECVYQLGRALWPNGTPEPHGVRNGEPDSEGGYALRHERL